MKKITEKARVKIRIIALSIIIVALIASITSILVGNSNTKTINKNSTVRNTDSVDIQKPRENKQKIKIKVQPIVIVPQAVEQKGTSQETNQTREPKQTVGPVKSIQEGQPQTEIKPTPPPKPVPQGTVTDKTVKPDYKEEDVKPQQNQPKMGDKNDNGQIYIDGFGWVKDEGGGGKGTVVHGMKENGNKIGIMD